MEKTKPETYGITLDDIALESENQRKRNDDSNSGCIGTIIGVGLYILICYGGSRIIFSLGLSELFMMVLSIGWTLGSFFIAILIVEWCYKAIWKEKIPKPDQRVLRYHEAVNGYNVWLENEQRKKKEFWSSLSGYRFEEEVGKILKTNGYEVYVTKGSADGGVDIVATKINEKRIIQCKAHKKPIGPAPIRELLGVFKSGEFNATSAVVIGLNGFTSGAREFASKNNIELWDIEDVLKFAK